MQAVVLPQVGGPEVMTLESSYPVPVAREGEGVVRLRAAALNHRDVWIRRSQYAGIRLPVVLGSDGAGEVVSAGDSSSEAWLRREVIIDPAFKWGPNPRVQGDGFNLLGMPTDGTYAEFVRVRT